MKKKQEFIGTVTSVDFPNKANVDVDGERVVVKNLIPGQKVRGVVTKKRSGKYLGRLFEVVEKSPMEIEAPCKVYGECGGCLYQSLPYEEQLKLKVSQVKGMIEEVTGPLEDRYEGVVSSPKTFRYRNKMEYSFGDAYKDGPLVLGMHKRGSTYDITDASECHIVHEDFNRVVDYTVTYFRELGTSYYHKRTHEGFLRYLIVRRGENTNELMVNIVTTSQENTDLMPWVKGLLELSETESFELDLVSVVHTLNDTVADAVKPDEVRFLHGLEYFYEGLLDLTFKVSPFSFFQTNSKGAEELYKVVWDYVGETHEQVVFDLYSGTGTITQLVSEVAKKAVGVEIVEEAVDAAWENAKLNGLDNCEFIAGDVLKVLDELTDKPDMIILDPPRDGIHPKALPKIIDYGVEKMVYVSCKPSSLARDLKVFMEHGYEVERMKLVDMFPHTPHVETIVRLVRK